MHEPDRRRAPRFPINSRSLLRIGEEIDGGRLHGGDVLEISLCGGLFVADPGLSVRSGRPCNLTLFNGRSPSFLTLSGVVVNCRPRQVGVAFREVDEGTLQSLLELLEERQSAPANRKKK